MATDLIHNIDFFVSIFENPASQLSTMRISFEEARKWEAGWQGGLEGGGLVVEKRWLGVDL